MTQEDQAKQEREYAKKQHDRHDEFFTKTNQAAIDSANFAVRALLLINGGAAVAMLGFVASVSSNESFLSLHLGSLLGATKTFAFGVASAVLSSALAYIVVLCDAIILGSKRYVWSHPYIAASHRKKWLGAMRNGFHVMAFLAAIFSFVLFLWGVWSLSLLQNS